LLILGSLSGPVYGIPRAAPMKQTVKDPLEQLGSLFSDLESTPPQFRYHPRRAEILLRIAEWLETNIRPGQLYDLAAVNPHPVWKLIEGRLLRLLSQLESSPQNDPPRVWQWYNSGVIITAPALTLALDLVPVPRPFGWPEPAGLSDRIASRIDGLLVTHPHPDHYDRFLVHACLRHGKPVYLPAVLSSDWTRQPHLHLLPVERKSRGRVGPATFTAHPALHVWRDSPAEVPSLCYEVQLPGSFNLIFTGDADYTRPLEPESPPVDWLFVTWRSPNASFDPGDPAARGRPADALRAAADRLHPAAVILEHYAELEHIYQGYPASLDLAVEQIRQVPATDCLFWAEVASPPRHGLHKQEKGDTR